MKKLLTIIFAVIMVSLCLVECNGQLNTTTRLLRFSTGVQYSSDTAEVTDNIGRIWYDFDTEKFRVNEKGTNTFLLGAGSSGSYWPLGGSANVTGNVSVFDPGSHTLGLTFGEDVAIHSFTDAVFSGSNTAVLQAGAMDLTINSSGSLNFTNSLSYNDFILQIGLSETLPSINPVAVNLVGTTAASATFSAQLQARIVGGQPAVTLDANDADLRIVGDLGHDVHISPVSGTYLYLNNLPTVNPCASSGSGAIWVNAGVLTICP